MKRLYKALFIISFSCVSTAVFGMNQELQKLQKDIIEINQENPVTNNKAADGASLLTPTDSSKINNSISLSKSPDSQCYLAKAISNFNNTFTTREKIQTALCAGVVIGLAYYLATTNVQF
jgi:hypothetical protein